MYPEVEQYIVAKLAIHDDYAAADKAAWDAYYAQDPSRGVHHLADGSCPGCEWMNSGANQKAMAARFAALDAAADTRNAARRAARADLASATADPLVRWIAQNALRGYPDEAELVLRALPASMGELDALAADEGWCEAWDEYKDLAAEAGVLPGQDAPAGSGAAK